MSRSSAEVADVAESLGAGAADGAALAAGFAATTTEGAALGAAVGALFARTGACHPPDGTGTVIHAGRFATDAEGAAGTVGAADGLAEGSGSCTTVAALGIGGSGAGAVTAASGAP
jgi:hypothetical protein